MSSTSIKKLSPQQYQVIVMVALIAAEHFENDQISTDDIWHTLSEKYSKTPDERSRLPKLLSVAEVSDFLGVSQRQIFHFLNDGSLKRVRIAESRSIRILESDVLALIGLEPKGVNMA